MLGDVVISYAEHDKAVVEAVCAPLEADAAGEQVLDDAMALEAIAPFAADASFRDRFAAVRRANKSTLAAVIADRLSIKVDPDALFDVQIKRIHEYKRQLLNILDTIALYNAIQRPPPPRR